MAGAERLCHFLNGVASLCHIFKWGREMKKVGNHCCEVLLSDSLLGKDFFR